MNQRAACIVALLQACGAPCARAGQEPAAGVPADERSVYLCSHATGWGLDDGTRLAPLGHSELALVYQVGRGRLVPGGDTCSLMATDAVNGWGSWQGFYDPQFRGVAEASRLGAPRPGRQAGFLARPHHPPPPPRQPQRQHRHEPAILVILPMPPRRHQRPEELQPEDDQRGNQQTHGQAS